MAALKRVALTVHGGDIGKLAVLKVLNVHEIDGEPNAAGMHAVISGQSHTPSIFTGDNVLSVDSGSAGPRRFKLPMTVAPLNIRRNGLYSEIVEVL